jgi:hypothetical protein
MARQPHPPFRFPNDFGPPEWSVWLFIAFVVALMAAVFFW